MRMNWCVFIYKVDELIGIDGALSEGFYLITSLLFCDI